MRFLMFRPKKPYEPWEVEESDFPKKGNIEDKARFLLQYAILAPSSFNVQPWKLKLENNKIIVKPDFSRQLPTSDRTNRLLYISLGCLVKNFEISANWFGFSVSKRILTGKTEGGVELTLKENGKLKDRINPKYITKRLSNRFPYKPNSIPQTFLNSIENITRNAGLEPMIITDNNIKKEINKIIEKGDDLIWNDYRFKEEHLKWIRNNLTKKPDGMPAFTVGIPLLPSLIANFVIRKSNFAKTQSRKNQKLLATTPYYFFILSRTQDIGTWINIGQTLEEIWVRATEKGISMTPLAQLIEIGDLYKNTMIALKTNLRPQFFMRMGYSTKEAEHSPRRSLEDMLIPT
jgi:hypothetical protein